MSGERGAKGAPHPFIDEELDPQPYDPDTLAWMGEHLTELRRSAYGQRLLYQSLGIGFVVGLVTYIGGYLLKSSLTTEPFALPADLLYAMGYALWTGVVVVVFVQVIPEVKRRQLKRWLDAYEATPREQARAGSDQASGTTERRRRGSGQAERPAGWCDTSWSMIPTASVAGEREHQARARHDGDAAGELLQLGHALLAAHAHHPVAPIQRVPHHVPPELAGCPTMHTFRVWPSRACSRRSVASVSMASCLVSGRAPTRGRRRQGGFFHRVRRPRTMSR
jgi:hypothetical protein